MKSQILSGISRFFSTCTVCPDSLYTRRRNAVLMLLVFVLPLTTIPVQANLLPVKEEYISPKKVNDVLSYLSVSKPEILAISVSGTIKDQAGEPLIGVNIQVKGTSKGTSTDLEGHFTLEDIEEDAVLVVSYLAFQTQEITLDGETELDIVLISDSQLLDEVVVDRKS